MTPAGSSYGKTSWVALAAALAAGATLAVDRIARSPSSGEVAESATATPSAHPPPAAEDEAACAEHRLARPTGAPMGIGCAEVRRVVRQIRSKFPVPFAAPTPNEFAELVTSWLDPHGLWSAANDAPPRAIVFAEAEKLLAEVEGSSGGDCEVSREVGVSLVGFMGELRCLYDEAAAQAPRLSRAAAAELGLEPAFDDEQVTTPARVLARDLGRRLGAIDIAYGESVAAYVGAARDRYFPPLDADGWQRVVLAAGLRGYVVAIDPHGQWAPLDEEWSLYAGDPSFYDPDRLWGDMVRTAFGLRVVDQPVQPLEIDDLVLEVDGVPTTGLSFEQADQLSRAAGASIGESVGPRTLVVLRQGEASPRTVEVASPTLDDRGDAHAQEDDELEVELVPYGRSYAAVVSVPFVRDDLGARLAEAMDSLVSDGPPEGLLLDLRGNAGGSMDGATGALSMFLPDVPVFPLFHGGRMVEVLTTHGGELDRFAGPLAVLVDGRTASAAEMIAGALDRYHRAVVLGQPTYGKGCVQEYFEDDAGAGVLRLTTRLFTFPDGSAVQRRGLVPAIALHLPRVTEHEADVQRALAAVEGPDVRVTLPPAPVWPSPSGRLGPCRERIVCTALNRASRVPARAFRSDFGTKGRRGGEPFRR